MSTQPTSNSINVANPALDGQPRSYLTQDVNASGTTITLSSVVGFPLVTDNDYYVIIGEYGEEKAEIKLVDTSATSGNVLTIAALSNSHEASDPVTVIPYNQMRLYGLESKTSETYNLLETKNIDSTSQFTELSYTGVTYSFFATAYYNSTSDVISGYSEVIESSSFTRRSIGRIIKSALRKAQTSIDENPNGRITWDVAMDVLQDGLDEIIARKKRWPFLNVTTTGVTTANISYITKPSDLTQLVFLKVNGKTLDWFSKNVYNQYTDGTVPTGEPVGFTEKNGKYYLYPTPSAEYTTQFDYFKVPATITDLSTEVDIPFVSTLIYYCGSEFAYIRGNDKKGASLYEMYVRLLEEQVEEYTGPDQDGFADSVERTDFNNNNEPE